MFLSFNIGPLHLEANNTWVLHVSKKEYFHALNQNNIQWFPDMNKDRANNGWIWFDSLKEYRKAIKCLFETWYTKPLNIPCKTIRCGNPIDGYDIECNYENGYKIECDQCVCTGGSYNPITGEIIPKRLRKIQTKKREQEGKYHG